MGLVPERRIPKEGRWRGVRWERSREVLASRGALIDMYGELKLTQDALRMSGLVGVFLG